ncbi:glycosyltransferase family 2 protein [Lacihabitans sp. CS3-21]|uniref:glycosyltransferase family 2 protein n=1 Tax=Lacihabitans sp. CS3-21 TaxID=2487332 RepID=UPI0020CC038B|nr:glycosyltransferase family 2 protein [Lacihabitans sp. CS3-21]MCP9748267.1 glycosyltransferase family 2 protein [Lacihabitans sp. CS3-21]
MSITAVILTFNEEKHIERCITSLKPICERICIVDSYSTDTTLEICKRLDVEVFQNKWENNHSKQMNWAIENCHITSKWTMRMDADEYVLKELQTEINSKIETLQSNIAGIELKRRVYFKNKWIKHGGFYPIKLIRIWKTGKGYSEERFMDEHIVVNSGEIICLEHDIVDENLNDINWWTAKHLNYARREAVDFLSNKYSFGLNTEKDINITKQAERKRKLKDNFYYKLPYGLRPMIYFFLRFIIQLGFLDGPKGWIFHFLQAFWYRIVVDINIYEIEKACEGDSRKIEEFIIKKWGINF